MHNKCGRVLRFCGSRLTNLLGRHLLPGGLHDEPEAVAGDGADAEGRHEDGEVLGRLQELAQELWKKLKDGSQSQVT